ncbi:hypothetical protein AB0N17_21875 [Streptomyces sp. NPDC051133]|uniref:hypothetical protein n=1 Tax=Streptomyces sp. NPDC051133 TaxID=3155521 RepID=UPI003425D284
MVSRASSEAPAGGLPVAVPKLPGLGTTWYERGPRYWLRRVLASLNMLLAAAIVCFVALSFYSGFRDLLPSGVRVVWDGVQVAASFVALAWGWASQRRGLREALLDPPDPGMTRRAKRDRSGRVPGLIALGRGLMLLAAPVLPAFAAWCVGWFAASIAVREYPSEVGARRWLEAHNGQSRTS